MLLCNAAGIYLGMLTCRLLEVKEYDWGGNPANTPKKVKTKVISALKKGVVVEPFYWDVFSSGKRFFAVVLLGILIEIVEVNAFFLKFVLWIPPPNKLNVLRLILWFLIGLPALRESYQFATDR